MRLEFYRRKGEVEEAKKIEKSLQSKTTLKVRKA